MSFGLSYIAFHESGLKLHNRNQNAPLCPLLASELVQMGWACLNIVSKFTMIFFIQRVKDNYWNRVKLTRELKLKALGVHVKVDHFLFTSLTKRSI